MTCFCPHALKALGFRDWGWWPGFSRDRNTEGMHLGNAMLSPGVLCFPDSQNEVEGDTAPKQELSRKVKLLLWGCVPLPNVRTHG